MLHYPYISTVQWGYASAVSATPVTVTLPVSYLIGFRVFALHSQTNPNATTMPVSGAPSNLSTIILKSTGQAGSQWLTVGA
jgi:hypothetical protein